jgi:hypothetical protein
MNLKAKIPNNKTYGYYYIEDNMLYNLCTKCLIKDGLETFRVFAIIYGYYGAFKQGDENATL